jgi:hypothetical protein
MAERCHHAPGNHAPALLRQLPRGNPSLPLWGTVRHGQCQLRGTVPPTAVRLTPRALEGGPDAPSNCFLVNPQGQTMTLGRRDAIPVTVDPVRPPPCLQHDVGHCCNNSIVVRAHGDRTPPRLPLYPVRITVSGFLEPVRRCHGQLLRPHPRSRHCSGTGHTMMTRSWRGPSRRPPTSRRCTPYPRL